MKKAFGFIIILALMAGSLIAGYALGQQKGERTGKAAAERELKPLVEAIYPAPPAVVQSLTGTVKVVAGGTISLEVQDPADYLPHLDGSPVRTTVRAAIVSSATKITLVDTAHPDKSGAPATSSLRLSDLRPGDIISVTSEANIRDVKQFDVTEIQLVL